MSDAELRGGQRALLGFYFQFLGTPGIADVRAEWLSKEDSDNLGFLTEFKVNQAIAVFPEMFGQDLWLKAETLHLLVQYKYSDDPGRYPLGGPELIKIVRSFASTFASMRK